MKKLILFPMLLIVISMFSLACDVSYGPSDNILIYDVIEDSGNGADCKITIYKNNTLIDTAWMDRFGLSYSYDAGVLDEALYISNIQCNLSNSSFLGQCKFTVEVSGGSKMIIAVIILLPMILGLFMLIGAATLGEQHTVLKISLFLFSIITFFSSMHFSMVSIVKFYNFPVLENLIGSSTYWFGMGFFMIMIYFLLYTFYVIVKVAAQNKKERLRY